MNSALAKVPVSAAPPYASRNLYYPCSTGYIFAVTKMTVPVQLPFHGLLAIAADDSTISVSLQQRAYRYRAMAMCPRETVFSAQSTRLVCIAVNPLHRQFRSFRLLQSPHIVALPRLIFSEIDDLLNLAIDGVLRQDDSLRLFDTALQVARDYLPALPPVDPRAQELVTLLWAHPTCTISELANHLGLSYHRTSHLFADAIGIPMRTYQLWRKLFQAGEALVSGASVTEAAHAAGFSDSAHYSSAFQKAYGCSPSALFKNNHVKVFSANALKRRLATGDIA